MEARKSLKTGTVVSIVLAVAAVAGVLVAVFLWQSSVRVQPAQNPQHFRFDASPEAFSRDLEPNLKASLKESGIAENLISISKADSTLPGINRIFRVRVPQKTSLRLLNVRITLMAEDMGGGVFQGIENATRTSLTLKVGAGTIPTDIIIITRSSRVSVRSGKMAIIVDDFGNRPPDLAEKLCVLDQEVTLSILPFQPYTRQAADIARKTDTLYIVHIPMEPQSSSSNPGQGAIMAGDTGPAIREKLSRAFANVPGARGCNNHEGSKATEDVRVMEFFCGYLAENDYFFVDSQTSRQSVGYSVSQKNGVKSGKLTSYLDVEDDPAFIEKRLTDLAERAFAGELVIAIGHDRPNTIEVLERKLPELADEGIIFIKASEAVR